jgi:hypothetical protein
VYFPHEDIYFGQSDVVLRSSRAICLTPLEMVLGRRESEIRAVLDNNQPNTTMESLQRNRKFEMKKIKEKSCSD